MLDLLDAFVFFGLRSGVRPIRILHSIAAGLLGRASFSGGWRTATLGLALHFFIAFVIVLVFMMASRRLPALRRHAVPAGLLYGIAVYLTMTFVVVPASAAAGGVPPCPSRSTACSFTCSGWGCRRRWRRGPRGSVVR